MNSRIAVILSMLFPLCAGAQTVTFDDYLKSVGRSNASAVAEKYNLDIAEANLQASRVFNDPELSVSYGNNQDWDLMMGQNVDVGLDYSFSLGGVRHARINVSESEKNLTEASLDAFLCDLRAEASLAWSQAWKMRENCRLMEEAVNSMEKIASGDSLRLSLGDVSAADAAQSRLEAQTLRGELTAMRAEYRNALMHLEYLAGGMGISGMEGERLPLSSADYSSMDIYGMAESARADLKAAELSHQLSERNLALVKASRAMEMGLSLGYSFNTEVRNDIAPAPQFNGLVVGVSIPLKFSSLNKGEVRAAQAAVSQQQVYTDAARRQVRMEVAQAYNSYQAARDVLNQYDDEMLASAESILESRMKGYQQGENSLLEYLSARQTYNDVMKSYIDACCGCFDSEVLLQRALGQVF